jgi:hypothetical protein
LFSVLDFAAASLNFDEPSYGKSRVHDDFGEPEVSETRQLVL